MFAVIIANILLKVTSAVRPSSLPELAQVSPGASVVAIAGALTLAAGAAVGLLAGLRSARRDLGGALRIGQGSSRANAALRSSLVVSEIALSATLLVGALLLIRSVATLQHTPLGFESRDLYGATFNLRATRWSGAERFAFAQDLARRASSVPGVASATVAATVPPNGPFMVGVLETPEHPAVADAASFIGTNAVSPDYFSRLGIVLVAGRTFGASPDRNDVVMNEALAMRLWHGESAVGKRFRVASAGPGDTAGQWWTVVGVTRNAVVNGLTQGTSEVMYTPLSAATDDGRITLIVRGRPGTDPTPALRHVGGEIRPDAPNPTITNVAAALDASMAQPRFAMQILTAFAVLAVIMAAIGLYGVISYTVSRRTREIGIRMTLGATRSRIARLVVGNGLRLAGAGVVVGLAGAWATARLLEHSLYGVQPHDVWSFAIGGATLVLVSLAACLIPMARATAVDPVVAVRAD
jgi:predicted permease